MSKATDRESTRPQARSVTRRAALQSAIVLAACGVANTEAQSAASPKPKTRDNLWIPSTDGQFCCGITHRPAEISGKRPGVLLIHDLRGSKDQPHRMLVAIADELASSGQIALRFDLLGRGDSEGSSIDATPQRDIENSRHALAALQAMPDVNPSDITVIGFGWGGTLAAYLAGETTMIKRVVLLASCPVDNENAAPPFKDLDGRQVSDQLGNVISKDFYDAAADLTPLSQLRKNRQAVLMVYGQHDAEIRSDKYETCKSELTFADVNTKAAPIEGADHQFSGHDFEKLAIAQISDWLAQQ